LALKNLRWKICVEKIGFEKLALKNWLKKSIEKFALKNLRRKIGFEKLRWKIDWKNQLKKLGWKIGFEKLRWKIDWKNQLKKLALKKLAWSPWKIGNSKGFLSLLLFKKKKKKPL